MRLLPALLILIGCADADPAASEPAIAETTAAASGETALTTDPSPEAELVSATGSEDDWEGQYTFTEGGGQYTYEYSLDLLETEGGYVGTFSRVGPQETRFYDVYTRESASGGIAVILDGFGEENAHAIPEIGATLFELRWEDAGDLGDEIGDRVLMTYWGALTKTGVEGGITDEKSLAFSPVAE